MEQKEDENGENKDDEKEEIDLGDRDIDEQNQLEEKKEKELAAGDNDK